MPDKRQGHKRQDDQRQGDERETVAQREGLLRLPSLRRIVLTSILRGTCKR
jgi:hypothetical protein